MKTTIETDILIIGAGPDRTEPRLSNAEIWNQFCCRRKGRVPYSLFKSDWRARTYAGDFRSDWSSARGSCEGDNCRQGPLANRRRNPRRTRIFRHWKGPESLSVCVDVGAKQNRTHLLYGYLQQHQGDVLWKTELQSLSQDADGVVAQVKTSDDETQAIAAKYVVGCDR